MLYCPIYRTEVPGRMFTGQLGIPVGGLFDMTALLIEQHNELGLRRTSVICSYSKCWSSLIVLIVFQHIRTEIIDVRLETADDGCRLLA